MRITILFTILALFLAFPMASYADTEWDGFSFELENLDGDDVEENEVFVDGTLYLVDFWASWCAPCSRYLPHLEAMVEEFGEDGFQVVLFCIDDASSVSTAMATLQAADYPFTVLFDTELDVKTELGVRTIPTSILFSADGEELWRHVGYSHGDEEEVREVIMENLPGSEDSEVPEDCEESEE